MLPYLLLASLNCAFGLIRVYSFTTKYGTLLPCSERPVCYLPLWVLLSSVSQRIGRSRMDVRRNGVEMRRVRSEE